MHPPAPELSVRACQMKVTARHVQCAKSNMCAAVAARARVVRGILPDEATQRRDLKVRTNYDWRANRVKQEINKKERKKAGSSTLASLHLF